MDSNAQAHVQDMHLDVKPVEATTPLVDGVAHAHHEKFMYGHKVGTFIAHHWCRIIIWIALIVATAFLIYLFYITAELQEHGDVSIIKVGQHYRCRGTCGCGPSCPFIKRDDPRAQIKLHAAHIDTILGKMRDMQKISDAGMKEDVEELSKDETIQAVKGELEVIRELQKTCLLNVSSCNIAAQQFAAAVASADQITKDVIDVNNRMNALNAIATIQAMAFSTLTVQSGAIVTMNRMQDLHEVDQAKIPGFDELMYRVRAQVVDIKKIVNDNIVPFVRSGVQDQSPYSTNSAIIGSAQSTPDQVVGAMAFFMNTADEFRKSVQEVVNKYNFVQQTFSKCVQKVEGFVGNNGLPNKVDSEQVIKLIEAGDYTDATIMTALEPEIVTNHHKYTKERASFDSGGGVPGVLDHDNDINPWVGIFGRPTYKKTNGESAEEDNKLFPLKQVVSQPPETMGRDNDAVWSFSKK